MNVNTLQTFLAVTRQRNITRAAEELFLSQPAVSRQIQQLECELGVALFDRMGKSLHLTEAGARLADEASKVLGQLQRAAEVIRSYREPGKGMLRMEPARRPATTSFRRSLDVIFESIPAPSFTTWLRTP